MGIFKQRLYTLFAVVYLGGLLAMLGFPPDLADPEEAFVYAFYALFSWLRSTIFGRIPQTASSIEIILHILSIVDLVLFFVFLGTAGLAAHYLAKALGISMGLSLIIMALLLLLLFFAGTLLVYPELLPLSIILALIPYFVFEYFVCYQCEKRENNGPAGI